MTSAILNSGSGAWAFEEHASDLADALWTEISATPHDQNYVLAWDGAQPPSGQTFIPWAGICVAADKRLQAEAFERGRVPVPKTLLFESEEEVDRLLGEKPDKQWVLKYPIGCGGSGHQMLTKGAGIRSDWPRPFVVQEFVNLPKPEVYRLYCVSGELFGWNARRFPEGAKISPWVAHARGARYVHLGEPPRAALEAATAALQAAHLWTSFGAVDLLPSEGDWVVLEVGTDGLYNHVDREFDNPTLKLEMDRKLAESFWKSSETKPWGRGPWKRRSITHD